MTKVITTSNQKGGCGKTTTVVSLAAGLALRGYSVTVVDCDQQMNATSAFGVEDLKKDQFSVVDAFLAKKRADQIEMHFPDRLGGRLSLMPGSRMVSSIQFRFDAYIQERLATQEITHIDADNVKDEQRHRMKTSLESLRGKRDFVIIDTPPELGLMMMTGLIAADYYLVPMIPSGFDLKGLKLLMKSVSQIRERYRPELRLLGVLLTKTKGTKLDEEIRDILVGPFGEKDIFKTEISDSVRHREATMTGVSIHEHARDQSASRQYLELADEVLERFGNPTPIDQSAKDKTSVAESEKALAEA